VWAEVRRFAPGLLGLRGVWAEVRRFAPGLFGLERGVCRRRAPAGTEAESEALAPGTVGIGGRWLLGPGGWCIIKSDV